MNRLTGILAVIAAVCTVPVFGQRAPRDPHIGYAYPAGGRRGTTVRVAVAGQFLRNVDEVRVSGDGVRAKVVEVCKPLRNINPEQRRALLATMVELRDARLAEMRVKDSSRYLLFPGERFAAERDRGKGGKDPKILPEGVSFPEHPLLVGLEDRSLPELQHIANEFFNPVNFRRRQPNQQLAEGAILEVVIGPGADVGERELRLLSPAGLTNAVVFRVDALPEVYESEPNDPDSPPLLPADPVLDLPVLINGQIMPGDVDCFRFRARRRSRVVIETRARSLTPFLADAVPGWFQPVVELYDADGREVAFADDYRFDPDPVLAIEVPADGEYELRIRDSIYRGREDFVYRVSVGELPFITSMFPLGAQAGSKTPVALEGWNLPRKRLVPDTDGEGDAARTVTVRSRDLVSNGMPFAIDTCPEAEEVEPNDAADSAQAVELPVIVNGRIGTRGDADVFAFDGRAGGSVVAEVRARRLRSPLDSVVRLTAPDGTVVAWNDDHVIKEGHLHRDMGELTHHADSYLAATLPADGVYRVRVTDARGDGGEPYAYRLRISPPQPDFSLFITPSGVRLTAGMAVPVTVHAVRRDGFDGAIDVTLAEAPEGIRLQGGRIPPGKDRVTLTLAAGSDVASCTVSPVVAGRADVGGTTVSRTAVPADDVMQAFLWRHLAPSREFLVSVVKPKWFVPSVELAAEVPIRVPVGGSARVRINTPRRRAARAVDLELREPIPGIALGGARPVSGGIEVDIRADAETVEAGLADNLIVEAFITMPATPAKGGKAAQPSRRVPLGVLPAIPFEVVDR